MNVSKYVDMYGNPIPRRCPTCNKILEDRYGAQKYCSIECREKAQKERDEAKEHPEYKHKHPSPSEREIEEINTEVMQPGSKYASYGQHETAKLEESRGKIHAPAGFTSYYEREKRRTNANEKNPTA